MQMEDELVRTPLIYHVLQGLQVGIARIFVLTILVLLLTGVLRLVLKTGWTQLTGSHHFSTWIELNVSISQIKLNNICVYNVVPPIQKYNTHENPEHPYLGTDEERKQYTLYFNEKLKEKCIEKEYIFFDIYNNYIDENGYLKKDLSDGSVHIGNGIYISNFIKENNL